MDYEKETRLAFRDLHKARAYKSFQTGKRSWGRFTSWREQQFVKKVLMLCSLTRNSRILDVPCGTGIMAPVVQQFPGTVIAADISREMMDLARQDYQIPGFKGFIQVDITQAPFKKEFFSCIITLGLMHRVPENIRKKILRELIHLSNKFLVISYSLDSPFQRLKKRLLRKISSSYKSAPSPVTLKTILNELISNGLVIKKQIYIMPFFSSGIVLFLEKSIKMVNKSHDNIFIS